MKPFTDADLSEYRQIQTRLASPRQQHRIDGHMGWKRLTKRFDQETLDAMHERIYGPAGDGRAT